MKYYVVADVHSFYTQMIEALDKAGFDKDNPDHTLVVLGDLLDRGDEPLECLKFVNSLERKILIRGNHEDLMEECLQKKYPDNYDYSNGTVGSILGISKTASPNDKFWWCWRIVEGTFEEDWKKACEKVLKNREWKKYNKNTLDYFETEHYVFVHGWIPCLYNRITKEYLYLNNWRTEATNFDWKEARWSSGIDCTLQKIFEKGKTIVCGHWHSSAWHEKFEGKERFADCTPYINDNVIAMDATTVLSGFVNCIVLED